jgi:hypothetical protein
MTAASSVKGFEAGVKIIFVENMKSYVVENLEDENKN